MDNVLNIFQTHKSLEYIRSKPKLYKAMQSWSIYNKINQNNENLPLIKYYFYNDKMCYEFMRDKFPGRIFEAYMKVPKVIMRADLWRYCIIYYYGGIYADSDTICKINPRYFITDKLLVSQEPNTDYFTQWMFVAPKGCPILKHIIDFSVERILNAEEIKGEHCVHHYTGPAMFTEAIDNYIMKNYNNYNLDKKNVTNYNNYGLKIINKKLFHNDLIIHLYAGSDYDGWKNVDKKKYYNNFMKLRLI